ncbi:MAG: dockerin type I repeat-containing protein [Prevotella sp.]|nr:dockerin type I repeat-containing protein [Prevotella sp.]
MQGIGDSDGTITLEVTPENAEAKIANFVVNNIGSEILSEDVSTRVAFEQDGWYYVYNVKFVNGAVPPVVLGDVNGDGSIDIQDVSLTVERILSKAPEGFIEANADLDGDGDITVQDVSLIVAIIISGN